MPAKVFVKPRARLDARDHGFVIPAVPVPITARKCLVEVVNSTDRLIDLAICHVVPRHVFAVSLVEIAAELPQLRYYFAVTFHLFPGNEKAALRRPVGDRLQSP